MHKKYPVMKHLITLSWRDFCLLNRAACFTATIPTPEKRDISFIKAIPLASMIDLCCYSKQPMWYSSLSIHAGQTRWKGGQTWHSCCHVDVIHLGTREKVKCTWKCNSCRFFPYHVKADHSNESDVYMITVGKWLIVMDTAYINK